MLCLSVQLEQENENVRRKLKLVEDDLDKTEERLAELQKRTDTYEGALEERDRLVGALRKMCTPVCPW